MKRLAKVAILLIALVTLLFSGCTIQLLDAPEAQTPPEDTVASGDSGIAVGNVIGSNIYNLLAVLGITSMVQPISLDQSVLTREFPVMLAFSVALWFFGRSGHITRWEGALLLLCYIAFIGWLFVG